MNVQHERTSDLNIGLNRGNPTDGTGHITYTVDSAGNFDIGVGSINYGGRWVRFALDLNSAEKFFREGLANIASVRDQMRPVGVRFVNGDDTIIVPDGGHFRLVGDRISIIDMAGAEVRTLPAAQYRVEWIIPPPAAAPATL